MAETVIESKEKDEDEKTFDQIDINKKSDDHGRKDWNSDDETGWGSTKGEEGLLRTCDHKEQPRGLIIYNGPHSASLSSLHRVHCSSKEGDNSSENSVRKKKILTRYDYMVLLTSFFAVMICTGIIGSMSVFYVEFLYEFPESKTEVALVPSLANGIYDIGGVVAGMMIDSIGCRRSIIIGTVLTCLPSALTYFFHDIISLIILLGIVCAFGTSIVMLSGMVRVGQTFGYEHQIGSVIISASHPAGFIVFPQIMPIIIETYSWRGALLMLSAITMHILPFGLLATFGMDESNVVEPVEGGGGGEKGGGGGREKRNKGCFNKCPLDIELLKNLKFQLFAISSALNWGSTYLVHLLIVDFATNRGFTLSQGASLLTLVGFIALASRILAGVLNKIRCINNITWYVFFSMAVGVTHACIPLTTSYPYLAILISWIGLLFGCRFSFFIITLLELVPVQKYSQALGYCLSLWGIAVMITGPIVGKISTIYESYDFSYVAGGITGTVCLIPLAAYLIKSGGRFVLNFSNTAQSEIQIRSSNGN